MAGGKQSGTMKRWPAGLAAVLVILGEPSAKADPGAMPDLIGYTLANVDD
jgi:hypothetical protein